MENMVKKNNFIAYHDNTYIVGQTKKVVMKF